jgi:hypothetical protein
MHPDETPLQLNFALVYSKHTCPTDTSAHLTTLAGDQGITQDAYGRPHGRARATPARESAEGICRASIANLHTHKYVLLLLLLF